VTCAAAVVAAATAAGALEARADIDDGFDAQNFKSAMDPYGFVTVNGARSLQPLQLHAFGAFNYAKDPLKFTTESQVPDRDVLAEWGTLDVGGSIGLLSLFEHGGIAVGAVLPIVIYEHAVDFGSATQTDAKKTSTGDLRTQVKATFLDREDDIVGFGVRVEAKWPTGNTDEFTSDQDKPSYLGTVIVEKKLGPLRVGAEIGYQFIESQFRLSRDFQYDDKLLVGIGAGFEVVENVHIVGELLHWTRIEDPWDHEVESPIEGGAAIKYTGTIFGMLGCNFGLNDGLGSPEVRVHLAIGFTWGS
jgi:hypothetical protein